MRARTLRCELLVWIRFVEEEVLEMFQLVLRRLRSGIDRSYAPGTLGEGGGSLRVFPQKRQKGDLRATWLVSRGCCPGESSFTRGRARLGQDERRGENGRQGAVC